MGKWKTIPISAETHKRLSVLKAEEELGSFEVLVGILLDFWEESNKELPEDVREHLTSCSCQYCRLRKKTVNELAKKFISRGVSPQKAKNDAILALKKAGMM